MKKNRMRLLSILCALMMIVGQLPVLAWAELNEASEPVPVADPPVDVFAAVPESAAVPADVIPVIPETPVVTDPNAQIPPADVPQVVQNQPAAAPAPAASTVVTEPQPQPASATQPQAAPAAVSEQQVQAAPAAEPKPQEPTAPAAASEPQAQQEAPAAASEPKAESAPAETAPASDETVANPSPAAPEEAGQSTETPKSEEAEKPAEADKPAEESNASEETKPTEGNQPSEETKPSEESKPEETTPTTDTTEPSETTPTTEDPKPAENTTTPDTTNPTATANSTEPTTPADNSQPAAAANAADANTPAESGQPADQTTDTTVPAAEPASEVPEKPVADYEMKIGDEAVFTIAPEAGYKIRIPGQEGKIQIDAESAFQLKVDITDEKDNQTTTVVGEQDKPFQAIFDGHSERTFLLTFSAVSSTATGTVKVKVTKVQKTEDPITPEANEANTEENAKPAETIITADTTIPADNSQSDSATNVTDENIPAESDNPADQTTDTTVPAEEPVPVILEKPAADYEMKVGDEAVFTIAPGAEYKIRIPGQEGRLQIDAESAFPLKVDITDEKGDKTMTVVGEQDKPFQTIFGGRSERTFLLVFSAASSAATGTVKVQVTKVQRTEEPIVPQIHTANTEDQENPEKAEETEEEQKEESEKDKSKKSEDGTSTDQDKDSEEKSEKDSEEKEEGESEKESKEESEEKSEEESEEKTDGETEEESEEPEPSEEPVTEFTCDLPGAQDISLAETISGLGIVTEEDMAAFMADIQEVAVTDPEVVSLTQTEDDWNFRILKDSETQEALTISMADETVYTIATNADGEKETASDDNAIIVSTENDYYLPEDANAYVETLTEAQGAGAVSAVQGQTEETGEASAYQVFDIGVENVDPEQYEGFQVELKLNEEVAGKEFRLYQVQDGNATDITDTLQLNSSENADGTQNVTSISFATEEFAQFVLCYSLEAFYQTHDGATYKITVNCDPEAGVPAGSTLNVCEILPEEEAYRRYLNESAEKLGVSIENVSFARFFDIEILDKNGQKIEPSKPAQVTITLQDALELKGDAQLNIVHFADKGTEVITDVQISEDGKELIYEQGSFSVAGALGFTNSNDPNMTIVETSPYQGTGKLGGVRVGDTIIYKIQFKNNNGSTKVVITDTLDGNLEYVSSKLIYTETSGTPSDFGECGNNSTKRPLVWDFTAPGSGQGEITLIVKVLKEAIKEITEADPVKTITNGGNKTTIKIGDEEKPLTTAIENAVLANKETAPYEGIGLLGAVRANDPITYQISYKNYKDGNATITIKDELDKNVEFESASDGGKLENGIVTWKLENVAAGKAGVVTLTVKVKESAQKSKGGLGNIVNKGETTTVQVNEDAATKLNDVVNPVPENPHIQEMYPDYGSGELGPVKVGEEIYYRIRYKNYKEEPAKVIITDKLDDNVTFKPAPATAWAPEGQYDEKTRTVTWTIDSVRAYTEGYVELYVTVNDSAKTTGKVDNTAKIQVGGDLALDTETITNPVLEPPTKTEIKPYKGVENLGLVKVGELITYEISYHNYKSTPANIIITDELDQNVVFVKPKKDDKSTYDETTHKVTWNLKNVQGNTKGTVQLTVKVLEGALASKGGPGRVINRGRTATVQVDDDRVFTLNDVENPVPDNPRIEEMYPRSRSDEPVPMKAGEEIRYRIWFKNYKRELAKVIITDKLDSNVTFISAPETGWAPEGKYDKKNHTVTWTINPAKANTTGYVDLRVTVNDSAKTAGKVANTAKVQIDSDPAMDTETITNPVPEPPTKREIKPYEGNGTLGPVEVGESIIYEISYQNYKSTPADIVIMDILDQNVAYVKPEKDDKSTYDETTHSVTWNLKNVPGGSKGTVQLTVKVLKSALVSERGRGSVVNGGRRTDWVKVGEDREFYLDTVENPVVGKAPTKKETEPYQGEGSLGAVLVGDEITYEITYENYKRQRATVTITDKLDPNVEFVSASDNGEYKNGSVIWKLDVKRGESGKVTLTVRVKESALKSKKGPGEVVNNGETATVQVDEDKPITLKTVKNPVAEKPTMQETKPYTGTGVLGAVKVGDSITYEISYHNYKSENATIVIKDTLDPNLKFEKASNSGTNVEGVVTWTLKDVKAGGKGKVTLTVKVLDGALASKGGPGKVVNNTWSIKVGDDEEMKFKLDTIENPVPEPPVKKETNPYVGTGVLETVNVDDEVTYEISYKNYKAEEATVVITDKLDKNVEFVSADNNGEHKDGTVTWTLTNVAAGAEGKVTLTVKVKESAKKAKKITNKASVKVGEDKEFTTEEVTNPVSNKTTAPETGDDSHNGLWLTLLILSLLGGSFFGVTAFRGKKTGKN